MLEPSKNKQRTKSKQQVNTSISSNPTKPNNKKNTHTPNHTNPTFQKKKTNTSHPKTPTVPRLRYQSRQACLGIGNSAKISVPNPLARTWPTNVAGLAVRRFCCFLGEGIPKISWFFICFFEGFFWKIVFFFLSKDCRQE